jgi:hypothetical protein
VSAVQPQQIADTDNLHQKHSAKRAQLALDGASALCKDVILDAVFSYVGIKDYIYAAGVSRQWRGRYLKLCYSKATRGDKTVKLRTSYESAARTAGRLQLALDCGLTVANLQKNHIASACALIRTSLEPVAVLILARTYGLQWTTDYTRNAAAGNDAQLLQWLLKCGCPYDVSRIAFWVRQHGNADLLECCHAKAPVPADLKQQLLLFAGKRGQLPILKWLHDTDTAWPATFYNDHCCWAVLVQWALTNGCEWGSWKCQLATPANFCCLTSFRAGEHNDAECTAKWCPQRQAAALFAWAHENGCPCSCGDTGSSAHSDSGDNDSDSDDSSVNDG